MVPLRVGLELAERPRFSVGPGGVPTEPVRRGRLIVRGRLRCGFGGLADEELGGQHWPFGDHSSAYVALSSLTEFGNIGFSQTAEAPSAATEPRAPTHAPPKRHDGAP